MSTDNLTVEQLEQALKIRRAKERMGELENSISSFHAEVTGENTVDGLYRVCSRFVAKVNNARSVLGTTKKARKGKKE